MSVMHLQYEIRNLEEELLETPRRGRIEVQSRIASAKARLTKLQELETARRSVMAASDLLAWGDPLQKQLLAVADELSARIERGEVSS